MDVTDVHFSAVEVEVVGELCRKKKTLTVSTWKPVRQTMIAIRSAGEMLAVVLCSQA